MEKNHSQASQLDGHSQGDNVFPELQDEDFLLSTPEQKPGLQKISSQDEILATFLSSGGGSSDLSTKESSETTSSSSSSSDAESGTYNFAVKNYLLQHVNGEVLKQKIADDKEVGSSGMLKEMKDMVYKELLDKVANYEIDLKLSKQKLQTSQEEITRLKYENLTLVEELCGTIEKLRASEENTEKVEHKLRNEFQQGYDQLRGELDLASQKIDMLHAELASERRLVLELQETIMKKTNDLRDHDGEMNELKLALHDAQEEFSKERSTFQSNVANLHEQNDVLKIELSRRDELVESLNKSFDASKLKYDMLMAEKDQVFAQLEKNSAEVDCREIKIQQMEQRIRQLSAESDKTLKVVEGLRQKVMDQEDELEKQRGVICERGDEKREVIRQLCFSLEYYRSGYHELRQAFIRYKQPAALLS